MSNRQFAACIATIIAASNGVALEPSAVTNAAADLLKSALGAEHACFEFTSEAIRLNGWAPWECSEILLTAERMMRDSTEDYDVYRRRNAVGMLGRFGDTNALPELSTLFDSADHHLADEAGVAFLRIARGNPDLLAPLKGKMATLNREMQSTFTRRIYSRVQFDLTQGCPTEGIRRNLLRFLLDQTAVEVGERAMLDEILCREVPKWRASPQRAENAARMIKTHPDDAGAIAFFEGVRADAIAAKAKASPETDRSEGSPAPSERQTESATSETAPDPWADLLRDLPEKQTWTPPPGAILPH